MVRRQYTQPPHRKQGGENATGETERKAKEGLNAVANTSEQRKPCPVVATASVSVDNDNDNVNGSGCNGSRPKSRERTSREGEDRIEKAQGVRCGDSESGSGASGGGGARRPVPALGLGASGEAWGAAAIASARNSERLLSGAGSYPGSKSSAGSELWAWAGAGGGAARGKAMLSAYGLQADRHNPTCPRGNPSDGTRRHGRWQRGHSGGTEKAETSSGGHNDIGPQKPVGVESSGAAHYRGGGSSGGGGGRTGSKALTRVSARHAHSSFGGSGRKQRSVAARSQPSGSTRHSRDRSSSSGKDLAVGEDRGSSNVRARQTPSAAPSCQEDGGPGAMSMATASPRMIDSPRSSERNMTDGGRPADQIQRALEGLLVPAQGSTPSMLRLTQGPHQGTGTVTTAAGIPATVSSAVSGQISVLTMDGRGGSAAPPYRPQQLNLRAPTTASCAPVFPGLSGPGGSGSGLAMIAAFEAEGTSLDGGSDGDDHSTPPVSRQRDHSQHSPWHARKHPRGFFGGRGGFGRCHNGRHEHPLVEHPLVGQRTKSGSGWRSGACYSSESQSNGNFPTVAEAGAGGADRSWATPPITSAKAIDEAPDTPEGGLSGPREPLDHYATASSTTQSSRERSRSTVGVGVSTVESTTAVDGTPRRKLDPFDRLTHGATAELPQSELIDHFKLAPRPTSRRGTRNQGVEGQSAQPEPAFCLFSRQRDGNGGGAVEDKEQRGEEEENKQKE